VLTRNEPTEIEVLNRLQQTSIHWHGIELESYYDGVAGWSGSNTHTAPPIVPGESFVARMTPPRAGTFNYHTQWHDETQLTNGMYGPLIVLPEGEKFDPSTDLTFVFSIGEFSNLQKLALITGTPQSKPLRLQTGKKYRFRFINISTNNQGMQTQLRNSRGPVDHCKGWRRSYDGETNQRTIYGQRGRDLRYRVLHRGGAGRSAGTSTSGSENAHKSNLGVCGEKIMPEQQQVPGALRQRELRL